MRYHFYNPHENKVYVAWYAELFENSLKFTRSSGSLTLLKASGSTVGLELLQEEDINLLKAIANVILRLNMKMMNLRMRLLIFIDPQGYLMICFYINDEDCELQDPSKPDNYRRCIIISWI
ncbi:hypothetical protein Tco_1387331 [Tanacetum coccineum]